MTMTSDMAADPSAAIRLTLSPGLPGECAQCRGTLDNSESHAGRTIFVDTGRHQEFYGNVAYCNLCVAEMARLLKFIPQEEYEDFLASYSDLSREIFDAKRLISEYETRFRGFVDAGFCPDLSAHAGTSASDLPQVTVDDLSDAGTSDGSARQGEDEVGGGAGAPSESDDDERVDELRSAPSSDGDAEFTLDI